MNLSIISPEIALCCGALIILLLDIFFAKKSSNIFYISHLLSLVTCAVASYLVITNFHITDFAFNHSFTISPLLSFFKITILVLLIFVILLSLDFVVSTKKISSEFLSLLLIATAGGMILISANDFLVFYLGLELQALPLYLLASLNRNSAKSSEAGMKYFILGCLASGILLFGISMIYGFSGTIGFDHLRKMYSFANSANEAGFDFVRIPFGVMLGFVMVVCAMFFKISAAPFHMWAPDVYEGSVAIVTTFFATVIKFAAIMALMRLLYVMFLGWPGVEKIFVLVSFLSLAVGSFGAIFQKNLKRLLAYSSIGHIGFIILGMIVFRDDSYIFCILYTIIYAIISIGSFGFLTLIKSRNSNQMPHEESDQKNEKLFAISSLAGLSKTNPVMAFSLAVLMFSSAGIPPFAGFFSKFYILAVVLNNGFYIIAILAVLFSVISAYYYLRVVKVMYFDKPQEEVMELGNSFNGKLIIFLSAIFNLLFIIFFDTILNTIIGFLLA